MACDDEDVISSLAKNDRVREPDYARSSIVILSVASWTGKELLADSPQDCNVAFRCHFNNALGSRRTIGEQMQDARDLGSGAIETPILGLAVPPLCYILTVRLVAERSANRKHEAHVGY